MNGFDASKYTGEWHEYKRFPAWFEIGLDCTTATYGIKNRNTVSVTNKGVIRIPIFGREVVISRSSISGKATVPNRQRPGELIVALGYTHEFAWILTRCAGLAPDNLDQLERNLAKTGVDVSRFELVDQNRCY